MLPFRRVTARCASDYPQVKHLHGSVRHVNIPNLPNRFSTSSTLHRLESLINNRLNPFLTETGQEPSPHALQDANRTL